MKTLGNDSSHLNTTQDFESKLAVGVYVQITRHILLASPTRFRYQLIDFLEKIYFLVFLWGLKTASSDSSFSAYTLSTDTYAITK